MIGRRRRAVRGAAALAALGAAWAVRAAPVSNPRAAETRFVAVRGGVLMLALDAARHGDGWPATLPLRLEDGRRIGGQVAWVHPRAERRPAGWTHDPVALAVRPVALDDDSEQAAVGGVYLVARLPADARGALRLDGQLLEPVWRDKPAPPQTPQDAPRLKLEAAPDRPDPESPFSYWRWALLAESLGARPPPVEAYGPLGALVAEHYADLWRLGLSRLEAAGAVPAPACRRLLTAMCSDRGSDFAAWVVDAGQLRRLLALLLDFERPYADVFLAARRWAEAQAPPVMRLGAFSPGHVTLGVANPAARPLTLRFRWLGADRATPGATVPAGDFQRIAVPRPAIEAAAPADAAAAGIRVLRVEAGDRRLDLPFSARPVPAVPPGVRFAPLQPPLSLRAARGGPTPGPVPAARATYGQLRKLRGRWEVLFDCRRPGGPPAAAADLSAVGAAAHLRGVEAVALVVGGRPPRAVLAVPERGAPKPLAGGDGPAAEVHRGSHADRWLCRIVLPAAWLPRPDEPLLVGLLRFHGDDEAIEGGPFAPLPWDPLPGRAVIDTSAWDAP